MRSRSIIIVGLSVGITVTMILYSHSIVSLIVPILVPDEGLQYKPRGEESKAEREEKERQAAYAKQQEKLEKLFEEKRDSSEICQVHKENLKADRVRIAYGLILPPQEYREAQERQFPNSNKSAHGGCIVQEPEFAYVLFCTLCRQEETRWEVQHHSGPRIEEANKEDFIRVGADEATSHLVKKVEIIYPELAAQARIGGMVRLDLYIDRAGRVKYVELLNGHPLLSQAAIDSAGHWRYRPFLRDRVRIQALTEVEIPFALDAAERLSQARH